MSDQIQLQTPGGFAVRIFADRGVCNVSREGRLEFPQGGSGSSDQNVPGVVFIGKSFSPVLAQNQYVLVFNRSRRLVIPYRLADGKARSLLLPCGSASDQFPVIVAYFDSTRALVDQGNVFKGPPWRYAVLEPGVSRIDLMSLKVHRPELKTFLLKEEGGATRETTAAMAEEKVRATDIVEQAGGTHNASNPVFQARLHLRQLALDRMLELPAKFNLKLEEVEFIRTFLSLMIKNERNTPELVRVQGELKHLDEFYGLLSVALKDPDQFDRALEQGLAADLASYLLPVIRNMRSSSQDREQQIRYWEWEYRLNDLSGGQTSVKKPPN